VRSFIESAGAWLGFGRQRGEFELLETEGGAPGYFSRMSSGGRAAPEEDTRSAPASLEDCIRLVRQDFRADINKDLIIRRFRIGGRLRAAAVFLNGMSDGKSINEFILREAMGVELPEGVAPPCAGYLIENVFTACDVAVSGQWQAIKQGIADGRAAVFVEGEGQAILLDTRGYEYRTVSFPQNEKVVRGPHEGFNENLRTNITLLRRLIRREDLVCEMRDVGGKNNLKAGIVYLEGSANRELVEEVKRRLARVDTRMVMTTGILEQLTERYKYNIFPQMLSTERPDRAAAHIMQGYVAVLLEGSPFANIMPTTLFTLMSSSEDAYLRAPQGNAVRVIRYLGAALSILLPGYFLSLSLYHQGMLSTEVLSTMINSRKMVFAPIGAELVFLLLVFQLIREAGLRVPGSIGQAIGIIGGLILGQAAVSANMASSVMLIVVALAGLGNFCIPDYSAQLAASYLRMLLVAAAWMAGLLGMSCVVVAALGRMAVMKSYGVPFLAPAAPRTYAKRPVVLRGVVEMHARAEDYLNVEEER